MAQIAHRACQWLGVAIETMSTDLSSSALRMILDDLRRTCPAAWPPPRPAAGRSSRRHRRCRRSPCSGLSRNSSMWSPPRPPHADDGHVQQLAGILLRGSPFSYRPPGDCRPADAATAAARTESSRNCRLVCLDMWITPREESGGIEDDVVKSQYTSARAANASNCDLHARQGLLAFGQSAGDRGAKSQSTPATKTRPAAQPKSCAARTRGRRPVKM